MWCSLSSTLNTKSEPGPAELPAPEEPQREQMPMLSGGARWATVWPNPLNWRTRERAQSRTCNLGQATLPFIRRVLCLRRLCTALCQQPSRMKDGPHLHQQQVQDTQPRRRGRPLRSAAIPQCEDGRSRSPGGYTEVVPLASGLSLAPPAWRRATRAECFTTSPNSLPAARQKKEKKPMKRGGRNEEVVVVLLG